MGLLSSVRKRLVNQFVGVALLENSCKVYVKKVKNFKVIYRAKKSFDIESKDQLSVEVINYLNTLQEEHEQTYIALFLNTLGQGAIAGCSAAAYEKFGVDKKNVKSLCVDKEFTIYASLIDIQWVDKIFEKVGLDFVFSPFLILNNFAKKEPIDDEIKLYILNTYNGLTIMIKQGHKLLYGSFFNIAKEENLLHDDFENVDSSNEINLEDDFFEEFDDEDDSELEEMQNLEDGSDFDEDALLDRLSEKDARLVKYLDASLKEFYNSDLYDSAFISCVKIYDDASMNEDVIHHIESELLLDTSIENINILDFIIEISEEEVLSNA